MRTWTLTDYGSVGDGLHDDSGALSVACTSAASANGGMVVLPDGIYRLAHSVTVPESVTLWFLGTAQISVDAAATLTLHGPIHASLRQIFAGTGTIAGCERIQTLHPQWFDATLTLPSTTLIISTGLANTEYRASMHTWFANTTPVLSLNTESCLITTNTIHYTGLMQTSNTQALQIPHGTTAQQPTGNTGLIRYNTDLAAFEGYGTGWLPFTQLSPNTATLTSNTILYTGNVLTTSTGALQVPHGTTAQRPTGNTGLIRYNTDLSTFEGYGTSWAPLGGSGGGWTILPSQNTTGNVTYVDVTGIANTATRVLIMVKGIKNGGAAQLVPLKIVQLGTATSVANTGYNGLYHFYWSSQNWGTEDTGIPFGSNWGTDEVYATMTATHTGNNFWMVMSHGQSTVGTTAMLWGTGFQQLAAPLSTIRLTTVGNTSNYVSGSVTVLYQ